MSKCFFKPWVGENYGSGGIFKKKILVVGESHYFGEEEPCVEGCEDFTHRIIKSVISGWRDKWTGTFRKFERSLVGHETTDDEGAEIWNSVAFYNYIQKPLFGPREQPKESDYEGAEEAFFEVLEELQPDVIIMWGVTRMYDNTPAENWTVGDALVVDGYNVLNGWYTISSGKKVRTICVYHPSTGYSWDWWYKVIKEVL